jgi:hypothetical protein
MGKRAVSGWSRVCWSMAGGWVIGCGTLGWRVGNGKSLARASTASRLRPAAQSAAVAGRAVRHARWSRSWCRAAHRRASGAGCIEGRRTPGRPASCRGVRHPVVSLLQLPVAAGPSAGKLPPAGAMRGFPAQHAHAWAPPVCTDMQYAWIRSLHGYAACMNMQPAWTCSSPGMCPRHVSASVRAPGTAMRVFTSRPTRHGPGLCPGAGWGKTPMPYPFPAMRASGAHLPCRAPRRAAHLTSQHRRHNDQFPSRGPVEPDGRLCR